jgi:hypothetical protein
LKLLHLSDLHFGTVTDAARTALLEAGCQLGLSGHNHFPVVTPVEPVEPVEPGEVVRGHWGDPLVEGHSGAGPTPIPEGAVLLCQGGSACSPRVCRKKGGCPFHTFAALEVEGGVVSVQTLARSGDRSGFSALGPPSRWSFG